LHQVSIRVGEDLSMKMEMKSIRMILLVVISLPLSVMTQPQQTNKATMDYIAIPNNNSEETI